MTTQVALYARVSSEKQAQENTIDSQIEAIESRIKADGLILLNDLKFVDNGYSGAYLIRPALEQLRDKIAAGEIDKVYIHSPDRLSRKYVYQILLLEEFNRLGVEVIFLNFEASANPEANLLLQMQGMIAEYERAKIMERNRRGKIHAAKLGSVSALGHAPYGYRYINKTSNSDALYEINQDEVEIVRNIFRWIAVERISIRGVCQRLKEEQILTRNGSIIWSKSSLSNMLKNTAYIGHAVYGKSKVCEKSPSLRMKKSRKKLAFNLPKRNYTRSVVEKESWINIPVPAIIDENIFYTVQEQLEENRKLSRIQFDEAKYLLQGLLVCKKCCYAYCGRPAITRNKRYLYYRCAGVFLSKYYDAKLCDNKSVRADMLETAVWEEVKELLKNPSRLLEEYQRRLTENKMDSFNHVEKSMANQIEKLTRGISNIIDSYTQDLINKEEFEPRIKSMRQKLKILEEQKENINIQKNYSAELRLIITNLEKFSSYVEGELENIEWAKKRDIIRLLVKRVEIDQEDVTVVFKVNSLPGTSKKEESVLQHRPGRFYFIVMTINIRKRT